MTPEDLMQYVGKQQGTVKSSYCTICNKFSHQAGQNVRNHVESIHYPNTFVYNCPHCDRIVNTRKALQVHVSKEHKRIK